MSNEILQNHGRRTFLKGMGAAVEKTLREAKAWGGSFILATTDYFNENTPHESIHALAEAGRRHGRL